MGRAAHSRASAAGLSSASPESATAHPDTAPTAAVGRVGTLSLAYVRRGGRTILADSHCTSPWHLLPPMYLDDTGSACTFLLNPSGGLVGGDRLTIHASVGRDAHVLISSPSANRVYGSPLNVAVQTVRMTVGSGAILEWLPELTIPFAGSRFRQRIHVSLAPRSTVLLWDAMAAGRIARDERWAFTSYENEIRLVTASGASLLERCHFTPEQGFDRAQWAQDWNYIGSLYLVGESLDEEACKRLGDVVTELLARARSSILGGVSEPAAPGLVVKLLARTAIELNDTSRVIWQAIRDRLWNLPLPDLRRY